AAGALTLGSITQRGRCAPSARRSASKSGPPGALTRMMVRVGSSSWATTASRAVRLLPGVTASSRSRITASARAAALAKRSGRSPGQNSSEGPSGKGSWASSPWLSGAPCRSRQVARLTGVRWSCVLVVGGAAVHAGGACGADHHVAVLAAPGVAEGDDRLPGPGGGAADVEHGGLAVERVGVVQRVGEGDLPEAEVRHQGALGDLRG